jgi:hypothetical protein
MGYNSNSIIWMAENLMLETHGSIHFQFLFGCTNHGIECFFKFKQYKITYMYK